VHESKKLFLKKRPAVSNIIGSLIVLAIVASVGSVILFQGLNQINAFNYDLTLHDKEHVNELREDIIFEHVTFDPQGSGKDLILYLANIGSVDSTIDSITVVKIDTQELIFTRQSPSANATILVEDNQIITLTDAALDNPPGSIWNSTEYSDSSYKITVGTSKDNFFSTVAEPPFGS
jgi:hypothetical protein